MDWEVEAVVDSRKNRRGQVEYRLKWKRVEEAEEENKSEEAAESKEEEEAEEAKEAKEAKGDEAEEDDNEDEDDEQSYSWVRAVDCHCEELIAEFEQQQRREGEDEQRQSGPVGVLIELLDDDDAHHTHTAILIEDVTALIAIEPAADSQLAAGVDDGVGDDSSGGLVEESDAVIFRVTEDGEGEDEDDDRYDGDESTSSGAPVDCSPAAAASSASASAPSTSSFPSSSSDFLSSASSFVRRSASPLVDRVQAVLSAFHRAPDDDNAKRHSAVDEQHEKAQQ